MNINKFKQKWIVFFTAIVLLLLTYIFYFPVILQQDFRFRVLSGISASRLGSALNDQNGLLSPLVFRVAARLAGADRQLQAGEYRFKKGASIYAIIRQIKRGEIYHRAFTLVDGWNFPQVMQALNQNKDIQHTLLNATPTEIAEKLQIEQSSPEGWLMPDTYFYVFGDTDLAVLKRAHQEMLDYLNQVWPLREKNLPYKTEHNALVVASLIERETGRFDEKPIIADVIRKRLEKWMPLQIDSSVIYGLLLGCAESAFYAKNKPFCSDFNGKLTPDGIKIETPYNTYLHYELPPTPIAMPGRESIYAALHPAETPYFYFFAKEEGHHVFSATMAEHQHQIDESQR
jgi:UPF0755 protein